MRLGFAVDASVIEADASRYHGKAPEEIDWSAPERQTRAVAEFLSSFEDEGPGRLRVERPSVGAFCDIDVIHCCPYDRPRRFFRRCKAESAAAKIMAVGNLSCWQNEPG